MLLYSLVSSFSTFFFSPTVNKYFPPNCLFLICSQSKVSHEVSGQVEGSGLLRRGHWQGQEGTHVGRISITSFFKISFLSKLLKF